MASGLTDASAGDARPAGMARRVFISYAHEPGDPGHRELVREFWLFLRENGIDAQADLPGEEVRRDWTQWMTTQINKADFVLVIASPSYSISAEGQEPPGHGRGVQWEARQIRGQSGDRDQRDLARRAPRRIG
jgi:hypothetical protein